MPSFWWSTSRPACRPRPTSSGTRGTATDWVARHLSLGSHTEVGLVHRLDWETSGALLFGKTREATAALARSFREGRVEKRYLAVAAGPVAGEGCMTRPLRKDRGHRTRQRIAPEGEGAPAATRYQALSPPAAATLVACWPLSGKTHQIRVHLASMQAPLLGDSLYGGPSQVQVGGMSLFADRPLLHAQSMRFAHPRSGATVEFVAPAPLDSRRVLQQLRPNDAIQ